MSPNAIRLAIGAASGHKMRNTWGPWAEEEGTKAVYLIPAFDSSLDAIMPVIRGLDAWGREQVIDQLKAIVAPNLTNPDDILDEIIQATAAQWCEAYLKACGKWVEDQA